MAIITTTKEEAWELADLMFPTDYEKDERASQRAGYSIYKHRELNDFCRICDLGDRLEVMTGTHGQHVRNIWIQQ